MDTLGPPSFFFFMMPDGRLYTQCSALSIMSHTLIPRTVGTGCGVHMKVAFHESDCCSNWSPEPGPSLSVLHLKPRFFSHLIFLLSSSQGVSILLPYAAEA